MIAVKIYKMIVIINNLYYFYKINLILVKNLIFQLIIYMIIILHITLIIQMIKKFFAIYLL